MLKPLVNRSMDSQFALLFSENGAERENARKTIVAFGEAAVERLAGLLISDSSQVRWEAAKALGEIGGPEAVRALVKILDDNNRDVRWLATSGLMAAGSQALEPLLHELIVKSGSVWVRESGIRVIDSVMDENNREILSPVLSALKQRAPIFEVPIAAYDALVAIRRRWGAGKETAGTRRRGELGT